MSTRPHGTPRAARDTVPPTRTRKAASRTGDAGPPRTGAGEKATLLGFLDHLRDAVADKAAGVPEPQVRTGGVPSGTSLLGLVRHLAAVERFYFLGEEPEDWDRTMRPSPQETAEDVLADYREAIARANRVIEACTDLTRPAPRPPRRGSAPSMRWVLVHMIEETGRHAGHADILRERIDGSTGR
ncbi:mini-circle protein [Streptomyces carminius]|uniref:Mini-circle protein n=1 Tax=Streptomyces carminius TaxID=2665496 RepID=A0A2M8LZ57_9ACTN|nr:DinB family protein [Streptomyces carminius]PJE97256.1 mini-circle protein [Streptomyces carminius]